MAIKIQYRREDYVRAVKAIGESVAKRAEEIVPDSIEDIRDIELFGNVEREAVATLSWKINAFAEDENGRLVVVTYEVDG